MRGRIFNCHHVIPDRIQSNAVFSTLVSGVESDPSTGLLGDLGGANIAIPNRHSEMRHQYHVWKELASDLDYVGFEHYRRIFFLQPFDVRRTALFEPSLADLVRGFSQALGHNGELIDRHRFDRYLDLRDFAADDFARLLSRMMGRHEIVTRRMQDDQIDLQWFACHRREDWQVLVDAVRGTRFYRECHRAICFELRSVCFCSMHIMRTETFFEYMAFWSECMEHIEPRVSTEERYLGYFSERLLSLFLDGLRLRDPGCSHATLPIVIDS